MKCVVFDISNKVRQKNLGRGLLERQLLPFCQYILVGLILLSVRLMNVEKLERLVHL